MYKKQLYMRPHGYWTKEKCISAAKTCITRSEFQKKFNGAYNACRLNKWMGEACSHMEIVGNRFKRIVYVYEFPDNYFYVGLTYNPKKRHRSHHTEGSVYNHHKNSRLPIPEPKYISEFLLADKAGKLEEETYHKYIKDGWFSLNRHPPGGLGGNVVKWTKEKCRKAALEFNNLMDFRTKYFGAYNAIITNHWSDELLQHMDNRKTAGYWTFEKCHEEARKFKSKAKFKKIAKGAHTAARRNGWLKDITSHMEKQIINKGKKVKQYSLEGKLIKTYDRMLDAHKEVGADVSEIVKCCKGKKKTAKGFIWKYA